MAQSDDNLFRQFRLPWVPAWVPDWIEAPLRSHRIGSALALALVTTLLTYAGWRVLQAQTGQADIDLREWEQRLSTAEARQRPVLLEAIFQLPNDGAVALGLAYLNSPDSNERRAAGLALRDAAEQWNQWPAPAATAQYERTVRLLAEFVQALHAPEQALAVDLARQAMIRPAIADPTLRDSLRAQALAVMSRANSAHSAGLFPDETRGNPDERVAPRPTRTAADRLDWGLPPNPGAPRSTPLGDPLGPRSAELPRDGDSREAGVDGRVAGGPASNPANRFVPAGFARPPRDGSSSLSTGETGAAGASESQVPLFDDRGRLIEVRTLDPAQLTAPGGLIPVEMSGFAPTRQPPGPGVSESSFRRPTAATREDLTPNRIGSARMADGSLSTPESSPGSTPVVPLDTLRRELALALERREQDLIASQREAGSPRFRPADTERSRETEIITSRPVLTPPAGDREAPDFPTPPPPSGINNPVPANDAIPSRTVAAPRGEAARPRLPSNPYRSSGPGASSEPTDSPANPTDPDNMASAGAMPGQRAPNTLQFNTPGLANATPSVSPGRLPVGSRRQVPRPTTTLSRLSHIEVMQRLRSPDPNQVNDAIQELGQRGFNADYVAVARRLTSPDPNERYQLVFDLLSSTRVDPNPFLRWLANDPDPEVQSLAIEALEMLNASGKNRAVDVTVTPSLRR